MDEVDFKRKISKRGPKLAKNLTSYIRFLMQNSHFIEAKFYHNQLLLIKPNHKESIILGYEIATHMLDIDSVLAFDKLLASSNAKPLEQYRIQLYFACSFGDADLCRRILNELLLTPKIPNEDFPLIVSATMLYGEYHHLSLLCITLRKNKKTMTSYASDSLKPIAIAKLLKVIKGA